MINDREDWKKFVRKEIAWKKISIPMNEAMSYLMAFGSGFSAANAINDLSQNQIKSAVYRGIYVITAAAGVYLFNTSSKNSRKELKMRQQELSDLEKM